MKKSKIVTVGAETCAGVLGEVLQQVDRQLDPDTILHIVERALVGMKRWPRVSVSASAGAAAVSPAADLPSAGNTLSIPIQFGGQALGQIELEGARPEVCTPEERAFLHSLAGLAGLALQNARGHAAHQHDRDALLEGEQKLARLLEILPVGVSILDAQRKVVYANPALERILDIDPAGLESGAYHSRAYLAADGSPLPPAGFASARAAASGQAVYDVETGVVKEDGETVWTSVSAVPVDFPDWKTVVVTADVTGRKALEESLRESEQRYSTLFQKSAVPTVLLKLPEVVIVDINDAAEALTGFTRQEMLGKTSTDLGLARTTDRAQATARFEQQGALLGSELRLVTRSGEERTVLVNTIAVRLGGQPYAISTIQDITERRRMEDELRRSNADLEQFAFIASHDLQEPLRTVAGMVELLRDRYQGQLDERADTYISLAVEAAQRMQSLINDLLQYSRVSRRGRPFVAVRLEDALHTALDNLQAAVQESRARVTWDPLPAVRADPVQLAQVLQNLLGNAIKFRSERPLHIHVSAQKIENAWQVAVRDNGIGIPPQYFERIFLVFQRLHSRRVYQGTGIGLALCKKIVERHGGKIWVESIPEQGATFYFTLPEAQDGDSQPRSN